MRKSLIPEAIALLILLIACCGLAFAQAGGIGKITPVPKPTPSKPKYTRPVADAGTPITTVSTGSLTIVAESGATVYLESASKQKSDNRDGKIERGKRTYTANDLKPGRYRVLAELDGYEDAEGKNGERFVEVESGKATSVEFKLRPTNYDFTLKTNVVTGEVTYGAVGGDKTTLKVPQDGAARLQNLRPGKYEVEISASGYIPWKGVIDIGEGKTGITKNLERRRSTEPMAANWTSLDSWDVPRGWTVQAQKLQVSGEGIALHRNVNFRNYADFKLVSDVKMVNNLAVSFVLRAQDKQNYYLIQITGNSADESLVLRGFVVKGGVAQRLQDSINIGGYANILTGGQFFELTINCVGNKFTVSISDSNTGDQPTLGVLTDFDHHFSSGAPGIAARGQEKNEIFRFMVEPIVNNPR